MLPKKAPFKKVDLLIFLFLTSAVFALYVSPISYEKSTHVFTPRPDKLIILGSRKPKVKRISITRLKINLSVEESQIIDGVWQISTNGASHLNTSARPGENGNIVIYGHNLRAIFGPLQYIRISDSINIQTEDGKTYLYKVVTKDTIKPNNLEYVLPKSEETLTVYTCNGPLDSTRLILIAKPI